MKRIVLVCILTSGIVLCGFIVRADFFIVPLVKNKFAPVGKTGQILCYNVDGTVRTCTNSGQDGEYQKGIVPPVPRFKDNSDGTVTDNFTGLIWVKNADCFGQRTWAEALTSANGLADGQCSLSDGSSVGEWRLPNAKELQSLVHFAYSGPALSNTAGTGQWVDDDPFTDVRSDFYFSSTTLELHPENAWTVHFLLGGAGGVLKGGNGRVWCVRGGR